MRCREEENQRAEVPPSPSSFALLRRDKRRRQGREKSENKHRRQLLRRASHDRKRLMIEQESTEIGVPAKFVSARRRNQHARRARYPVVSKNRRLPRKAVS